MATITDTISVRVAYDPLHLHSHIDSDGGGFTSPRAPRVHFFAASFAREVAR
jgi:hypothetical protein